MSVINNATRILRMIYGLPMGIIIDKSPSAKYIMDDIELLPSSTVLRSALETFTTQPILQSIQIF
jgi:hypothetical protein